MKCKYAVIDIQTWRTMHQQNKLHGKLKKNVTHIHRGWGKRIEQLVFEKKHETKNQISVTT